MWYPCFYGIPYFVAYREVPQTALQSTRKLLHRSSKGYSHYALLLFATSYTTPDGYKKVLLKSYTKHCIQELAGPSLHAMRCHCIDSHPLPFAARGHICPWKTASDDSKLASSTHMLGACGLYAKLHGKKYRYEDKHGCLTFPLSRIPHKGAYRIIDYLVNDANANICPAANDQFPSQPSNDCCTTP